MAYDDDRAPIWSLAAGGALIGGVGYALYKHRGAFSDAWNIGSTDAVARAVATRSSVVGFADPVIESVVKSEQLQFAMSNFEQSRGLVDAIGDIKTATYEAIASTGRMTHDEILDAMRVIDEQGSAADAYKAASDVIAGSSGRASTFESRLWQFAGDPNRSFILSSADISKGGYGQVVAGDVSFATLGEELGEGIQDKAIAIKKNLTQAAGGKFDLEWEYRLIKDKIAGKEVITPLLLPKVEGSVLGAIPLAETGYTYGGGNLTARYITRGAYRPGTREQISYAELAERTLGDVLSASKHNTELKNKVLDANQLLIDAMRSRDSADRAAAVWTGPFVTSGGAAKARITALERVAYGDMNPADIDRLLGESTGLYPFVSPGSAGKGTLISGNVAEDLFGPLGRLMSAEARPTQFIRKEWGVTQRAKDLATGFGGTFGQYYSRLDRKIQGAGYKSLLYSGAEATSAAAYTAPQLVTFYAKPSRVGMDAGYYSSALNQMISPEEGVISSSLTDMLEYERIVQKKIALDEGVNVNRGLLQALQNKRIGDAPVELPGMEGFVGIERGTGEEVVGRVIGAELADPNVANAYIRETQRLTPGEMFKFFSEENKFMGMAANQQRMREVLSAAGAGGEIAGQQVEAMFSGKLVGRNKFALITQQTEAASMFLSQKLDMGALQMSPEIQTYLADPAAALNVSNIIGSNAANADITIQKNLMGMAKGWGFTPEEMALTFGLSERSVLREAAREGIISPQDLLKTAHAPGVVGLFKGRLGDLATEGGAGTWGSFEQTGFRLLSMKGTTGERYAAELAGRIAGKGELAQADIMMSTLLGQEGIAKRFNRDVGTLEDFAKIEPDQLFKPEGRFVNLGRRIEEFGGSNVMYIPGTEEAQGMMGDIITSGNRVKSPLASQIAAFHGAMRRGKVSDDELEYAAASLRNTAVQASEAQAAARGKIAGTQILTGQRVNYGDDVFRVSPATGEKMYADLIERAKDKSHREFLEAQRQAFREEKVMTGGMWRHPTTGPESFQFVKFQRDAQIADNMVAAPTQFGKLRFQGRDVPIDASAMVGFKGDFDRDQFVLSVIGDKHTESAARRAIDNEQRQAYSEYLFNHYAIKDAVEGKINKAEQLNILSDRALAQGHRKLSTAKISTGQVNIALQKLKIGMQSAAPEKYRPMAELFYHMEEAAIGGKHGVFESTLYQEIAGAVREGGESGTRRMTSVLESLIGEQGLDVSGTITDVFGTTRKHSLKLDPRGAAEAAMAAYNSVSNDVDIAMKAAAVARGRQLGDVSLNKAVEMYHARRAGSVDFAQAIMQSGADNVDNFTAKASRLMRRGGARVRGLWGAVKRAKKPLLAGAGVAAGIMAMAPSTAGVLRTPEGPSAGRNMPPDDYGPPAGMPMNPPQPGMNASPRAYDIGSGKRSSHANIRMRVNDLNSSSRSFMRSARELSSGGNVNIRTRDDRSILDPQMLANKIHERL